MSNLLSKNMKLQQLIDSLNESQKVAVINNEKFLQIIAGPGSGKTRGFYSIHFLLFFIQ